MRRTPEWVRAVSAIITVAGLIAAGVPHRRAVSPETAVLDPFLTPAYAVAEIRDTGRAAFCHIEANRWRPGRPDSARLVAAAAPAPAKPVPDGVAMTTVDEGSRPLEPARWRLTAEVLVDRLAVCEAKGFTGAVISVGDADGSRPVQTGTDALGATGTPARSGGGSDGAATGSTATGSTATGSTKTGSTKTGSTKTGSTKTGSNATSGIATCRNATDGIATEGIATEGIATDGTPTDGTATGRTATGRTATDGTATEGIARSDSATDTARAPDQLVQRLVAEANRRGLVVVLVGRAPADR